jgi:hypothetical protein
MRSLKGTIAAALAAAVVLSSISFNAAEARPRHYHRGNAAGVAAVAGLFGVIAAAAAADSYGDRYYGGRGYYGGGPYYGAYGPGYGYGYAPRYYGYRHHHRHWR